MSAQRVRKKQLQLPSLLLRTSASEVSGRTLSGLPKHTSDCNIWTLLEYCLKNTVLLHFCFHLRSVPVIESLTARVLDNSSVEVKWTASADSIAKYKVTALATHAPPVIIFTHNTSVTLRNLVPGKEYNIRVAELNGEAAYARYADVNVTTCDIHPTVDDLRATFISDTSLIVTWSTAHHGTIHIIVCVISASKKNCALYAANGDSMKCKIDVADDDAAYEVRARLSAPLECLSCYSEESSVTVKRPATGRCNSGSSNGISALLTLAILLLPLMKTC
ncbi:uncharacterized protein LOC119164178 [Rhipicephalus microplus]|uniref:uncharacterized protein LOC119164178 n=1 Tax=Rhipicephalus microplus TaxID=6941 RepID=UPI003F6A6469